MKYIRYLAMLCAFFCALGLCAEVSAVEVDSGSTYCFGAGDFSNEEIAGICITDLPKNLGALMLGSRVLREGDVLTAHAELAAGAYVLRWQVLAIDGHITRGEVPFRVAK